jgi:hypothetical protein
MSYFGERDNALTNILYDSSYEVEIKGEKAWFPQSADLLSLSGKASLAT